MQSFNLSAKILVYDYDECNDLIKKLVNEAKLTSKLAYAPYSSYQVGAAVLLNDGTIVTGNNQENAAYPSGLCAERTALFYANAQHPNIPVQAIAIIASHNGDFTQDVCTPCGSCRQVLVEVENRFGQAVRIIMCSKDKIYEAESIKDLLPLSFGKDALV